MSEFFAMGGYAGYVWSSYGIAAVVLFLNAFSSWRRHQSILQRLKRLESNEL
jgi:heme exporter protein D